MTPKETLECVGTLLVPAHDVQELSDVPSTFSPQAAAVNLKKRGTAVGTLMVPFKVVLPHNIPKKGHAGDGAASTGTDSTSSQLSSLQRKLTDKMTGPPPDDAEADSWAD